VGRKMCGMRGWTILSCGTTCYAESLVDTFQGLLVNGPDNDPPTVKSLLEHALRIEIPKYSAARYLIPYGIEMKEFLNSRDKFGDERWNELSRFMWDYSEQYDVELIVSGWGTTQEQFSGADRQANGYIFSATRDGVVAHSDDAFYACGSGKHAAHSALSYFNCEPHIPIAHAVYYVAGAKFSSERTSGVGPKTIMRVAKRIGEGEWRGYFIQPDEIKLIRNRWDKEHPPKISNKAEDEIVDILRGHERSQRTSIEYMARTVDKQSKIATASPLGHGPSIPDKAQQ